MANPIHTLNYTVRSLFLWHRDVSNITRNGIDEMAAELERRVWNWAVWSRQCGVTCSAALPSWKGWLGCDKYWTQGLKTLHLGGARASLAFHVI